MPRTIQITLPPSRTAQLLELVNGHPGILGLRVQRGIAMSPHGDVVAIDVTNRCMHKLLQTLQANAIGDSPGDGITTSRPLSITVPGHMEEISTDTSEASWEEVDLTIGHESNMDSNGTAMMFLAGAITVLGVISGSVHVVVGAMVIAPGFDPLSRISLNLAAHAGGWSKGAKDAAIGYDSLMLGAAFAALLARFWTPGGEIVSASYLTGNSLVEYWSTVTAASVTASAFAAFAGAVLLAANRSVLTGGVMIALALVPSAAITAMALTQGDFDLAAAALLRWFVDVLLVLVLSAAVFFWKRATVHKRHGRT